VGDVVESLLVSEIDSQTGKKTSRESEEKEKHTKSNSQRQRKMNITDFLFESAYQIVTWVLIGLSIGFFIFYLGKGNSRGILWSLISLFVWIIVMVGIIADRSFFRKILSFYVLAETHFRTTFRGEKPGATFWVSFSNGDEAAIVPITDCIYVRFTNESPMPIMIDYYAVDIRGPGKSWTKTALLERIIGQLIISTSAYTRDMSLDEPTFEHAVKDVSILSGATAKGWLLIERPMGFDGTAEYRLRIRDIGGRTGTAIIAPGPPMHHFADSLSSVGMRIGNDYDTSNFHVMYYSDLLKKYGQ